MGNVTHGEVEEMGARAGGSYLGSLPIPLFTAIATTQAEL